MLTTKHARTLAQFVKDHPLEVAEAFAAIAQLLSSLEAAAPHERRPGGINHWKYLRTLTSEGSRWEDVLGNARFVRGALLGRVAASGLLLVCPVASVRTAATGYNAASQVLLGKYTVNGGDGADQMAAITHGAAFLGRLGKGDNKDLALSFIAAQLVLAYFVSGFTKLFGPEWTNGTALERVMRTHTYGDETFYRILRRYPGLGELLSHVTVAVETLFPLLALNRHTRLPALAMMGGFHVANAHFMGLGRFMLAFVGTYPTVLHALRGRHGA